MDISTQKFAFRKSIGLSAAAFALATLTGCLVSENPSGPSRKGFGQEEVALNIRMGVGSVTALRKSSVITLNKLIVVLSSSANDTIRDTITSSTTPALNTVSTSAQTVAKNYNLKALRSWKIVATSRDVLDSVIHRDSATVPALYAGDTAVVNLNLSPKFSMYEAKFLSLPDSIQSATPAQPKQVLCINRLVLKIDGITAKDSSTGGPCLTSLATHTLAYDYVSLGSKTIVSSGTSQNLFSIQFPTLDTGYIVGENVTLKSVNGGLTWSPLTTGGTSKTLRALSFLNGRTGMIAGGNDSIVIRRTTNGGSAWATVLSASSANIIRAMHLVNDTGWMARSHLTSLTGGYQYYITVDGGATWTATLTSPQAYSIRGVNGTTAWAVGPAGMIRKATAADGYFSTVQTSGTTKLLRSVFPVNASTVFVVGDTGTILKTVNGGSTWATKTSGTTRNLNSVYFLDAATGFAVGDNGIVLSTSDSGNTWTSEASPTSANLNSITFFAGKGYVVGDNGTFFILSGPRLVQMLAYGPMGSWLVSNPLYNGSKYVNAIPGMDAAVPLTLQWTGPTTGVGAIQAELGRVGKITINGTLPGTVAP